MFVVEQGRFGPLQLVVVCLGSQRWESDHALVVVGHLVRCRHRRSPHRRKESQTYRVTRGRPQYVADLVGRREKTLLSGTRVEGSLVFECGVGRSCGLLHGRLRRVSPLARRREAFGMSLVSESPTVSSPQITGI
jgi:hypothetical protein